MALVSYRKEGAVQQHTDNLSFDQVTLLPGTNLKAYRAQIRRYRQLTAQEEQDLAFLIQRGQSSLEYLEELVDEFGAIESIPKYLLNVETSIDYITAGHKAWEYLVMHNLRFAYWAAKVSVDRRNRHLLDRSVEDLGVDRPSRREISELRKYAYDRLPLADRIQEATIALMNAAQRYRPGGKRARFSSYAGRAIVNALTRVILLERYRDTLGPGEAESYNRTVAAVFALRRRTGHEPSSPMIEAETDRGWKAVAFRREEMVLVPVETLEERLLKLRDRAESDVHAEELLWDVHAPCGEMWSARAQLRRAVDDALDGLSEREAHIVKARFGLIDGKLWTLDELGKEWGVNRERIRQIEAKAMSKLRHPHRSTNLRPFMEDQVQEWPWTSVHERMPVRERQFAITIDTHQHLYPMSWARMLNYRSRAPRPESA